MYILAAKDKDGIEDASGTSDVEGRAGAQPGADRSSKALGRARR